MKKLQQDELTKLQYLTQTLNRTVSDLGIMEVQKHQKLHQFADLETQLNQHKRELNEKYGDKNINIQTGELTDAPKQEGPSEAPAPAKKPRKKRATKKTLEKVG